MAAKRTRKPKPEAGSRGLAAPDTASSPAPAEIKALEASVSEAGGAALARYRDPLGGHWLVLASLPLEQVTPTPFQRDLSEPHAKRLADVMQKLDLFLDPIIAVPVPPEHASEAEPARFWSPNGLHRLNALRLLGARSVTALLSPDPALAYRILALNTEKAHSVRERALEAVRMARGLSALDPKRKESAYALELEEGALVTLGFAYEKRPRFAGGAYAPALRASDAFLEGGIAGALEIRAARADRLLAIDDRVAEIVASLKARGFESPYIKNFVVSRLRPFRPPGKPAPAADDLLEHMEKAAAKFDVAKVKSDQLAKAGGAAEE